MTADQFRKLALSLPDTSESAHMGHPDFRVGGRIFATLGYPDRGFGMINLTPDDQEFLVRAQPEVFEPAKGGWGRAGSTLVRLKAARKETVKEALAIAWQSSTRQPRGSKGRTRADQGGK